MRLRGHHLFCATLFQGCGYDQAFTDRMRQTLSRLEAGEPFVLCCEGDVLCGACPHRVEKGCALSTEDVLRRDRAALEAVGLSPGQELTYSQMGFCWEAWGNSSGFPSAAAAAGKRRGFVPGNSFKLRKKAVWLIFSINGQFSEKSGNCPFFFEFPLAFITGIY